MQIIRSVANLRKFRHIVHSFSLDNYYSVTYVQKDGPKSDIKLWIIMSSAIYWNWHVMFPDPTHRYGSSLTAVRVRTRNDRSSMATAVSRPTRGIKNVYEAALMTMLGREQLVLDSPWVVLGRRKKKKNLFPVGKYNIDTHNAGMFLSWTWITMS